MTPRKKNGLRRIKKWASDPMMPIVAENLRAAIELDGRGYAAIAREVTRVLGRSGQRFAENRQTLYALCRGGRKCRQSRLIALADVLSAPSCWLQANQLPLPLTGAFHAERFWLTSPRIALALARLLQRCSEACARDLARYVIETAEGDRGELVRFEISNLLCWCLERLVSPAEWMSKILKPALTTEPEAIHHSHAFNAVSPMNDEACWLASINFWLSVLDPWIVGGQSLDYQLLAAIASVLHPIMRQQRPASTPPLRITDAVTGNELFPADSGTPFSLMPWSLS